MAKLVTLLEQHFNRQLPTAVTQATIWWETVLARVNLQESGLGANLPVEVCCKLAILTSMYACVSGSCIYHILESTYRLQLPYEYNCPEPSSTGEGKIPFLDSALLSTACSALGCSGEKILYFYLFATCQFPTTWLHWIQPQLVTFSLFH